MTCDKIVYNFAAILRAELVQIQNHFCFPFLYNYNLDQTYCAIKTRKTLSVIDSGMNVRSDQSSSKFLSYSLPKVRGG